MGDSIEIRRLGRGEEPGAFRIIVQLREALDEAEFARRVDRQRAAGYELVGAWVDGVLTGVMGMRPVHTLARGAHLHIDDLVVDHAVRGQGVGQALLAFAATDALARDLGSIFLDSRPEVVSFYRALGFEPHTATLMRIQLVIQP